LTSEINIIKTSIASIHIAIMADVATSPGATHLDAGAASEKKKPAFEKVEKPDEKTYNEALKKAEKDHADSVAKLVSCRPI
jgi:hypothetical protein